MCKYFHLLDFAVLSLGYLYKRFFGGIDCLFVLLVCCCDCLFVLLRMVKGGGGGGGEKILTQCTVTILMILHSDEQHREPSYCSINLKKHGGTVTRRCQ